MADSAAMRKRGDQIVIGLYVLTALLKLLRPGGSKSLIAENVYLRKELLKYQRRHIRAPSFTAFDRILSGFLTGFFSAKRLRKLTVIGQPGTLLQFHRALVKRKYGILFGRANHRRKPGPKGPSDELIKVIVAIKQCNRNFGCPRIASIISNRFGVEIDKDVVRRVLQKYFKPQPGGGNKGPSWLSFLGHSKDSLWSLDLFRCESITLQSHWILVVMDQFTRRIIGFAVHKGPVDSNAVCRMFNRVLYQQPVLYIPKRLSCDHDPLFTSHRWQANLRVLEIEEIKSIPYVPCSHPFVERLIGTVRQELLDKTLFWTATDLRNKLNAFQVYFNAARVHAGIDGQTPHQKANQTKPKRCDLKNFGWQSHCRGLFYTPIPT